MDKWINWKWHVKNSLRYMEEENEYKVKIFSYLMNC